MLVEALTCLLTPCPGYARRLGYARETVAIAARHRRCRRAWQPHLEASQAFLLSLAQGCSQRRSILLLGSGGLLDVPLEALAASFQRVVAVDLVHPWSARLRARGLANVQLRTADVTGLLPDLTRGHWPQPRPPDIPEAAEADLVVSLHILSQLPLLPSRWLLAQGRDPVAVAAWSQEVRASHVAWLRSLPGQVGVLTDIAWYEGDQAMALPTDCRLPQPEQRWLWRLAPHPEVHPHRDVCHQVAAFRL